MENTLDKIPAQEKPPENCLDTVEPELKGMTPLDHEPQILRDPDDALTISSLVRALWILLVILNISAGTNIYLAVRKADRIVIDKSSGRVVQLNNRDYGETENVRMSPDKPADADKKYLVTEFLRSLYEVERTTRESQVNKLLRMLEPDLSLSLAQRLKESGLLATERSESVNSTWELQDLTIDKTDPYILRGIGTRRIRRRSGGQDIEETVQLKCKFLLKDTAASPVRNENNLRTGFVILKFRIEPMNGKTVSPITLLSDREGDSGSAEQ